jgi:methylamine dehydrogenase light chain
MGAIDRICEALARDVAGRTSRRGLLARTGAVLLGTGMLPLLPVARAQHGVPQGAPGGASNEPDAAALQDPTRCEYWRHCAIDGYLCGCCGGSQSSCPPGTEPSPITWIGTCRNPADGKGYVISYNDCCGKSACGRCACNRNEGDQPIYVPALSNDINWCAGKGGDIVYHCSTAVLVGLAPDGAQK